MSTIPVIYENGVFRPTVPVVLPEGTTGEFTASAEAPFNGSLEAVYAVFDRRRATGIPDLAARIDELQP